MAKLIWERVGCVNNGIDGNDQFYKVTVEDTDYDQQEVLDQIKDFLLFDTTQEAGGTFCHYVQVNQINYSNSFVAIQFIQHDV